MPPTEPVLVRAAYKSVLQVQASMKPRLGIFWGIRAGGAHPLLIPISVPAVEVPLIGGFRTLEAGHVDAWPTIQRSMPILKGREYDAVPRGRVNWREDDRRYLLLADRKLLGADFLPMIMSHFHLPPTETVTMPDQHYRTPNSDKI